MKIRVGFEMAYLCPQPTPMILALSIHYSRASDLVRPDHLATNPSVPVTAYRDLFGNWCSRLVAPQGRFAHLAIAFCRCMNIPARYCTGYLGDFGTAPPHGTMDFAGWFEAYLGDRWYTFDARNNTPRIGRVLIARGRDACDLALSSTFGPNTLENFRVWADVVAPA